MSLVATLAFPARRPARTRRGSPIGCAALLLVLLSGPGAPSVNAAMPPATFADVDTAHPFFQFVEALAASGITGGCGDGNFCPDAPLTRGQMAVFLSTALGLHFGF